MSAVFDRWCSRGQHFSKPDAFRPVKLKTGPGLARDCQACEEIARARAREIVAERQPAVDIDRIHLLPPRWWEKRT